MDTAQAVYFLFLLIPSMFLLSIAVCGGVGGRGVTRIQQRPYPDKKQGLGLEYLCMHIYMGVVVIRASTMDESVNYEPDQCLNV